MANGTFAMSWNTQAWVKAQQENDEMISWERRQDMAFQLLHGLTPDLIGLQEMTHDVLLAMRNALPDLAFYAGLIADNAQINPIVWRRDRFEAVAAYGEDLPLSADANQRRVATFVRLQDLQAQQEIMVVSTHLDNEGAAARILGAKAIVDELPPDLPNIVMGDFNFGYWSRERQSEKENRGPYGVFIDAGFTDAYRVFNLELPPAHTFHGYKGQGFIANNEPFGSGHIDYVLVRGITVRRSGLIRERRYIQPYYPSDHYPVVAELLY